MLPSRGFTAVVPICSPQVLPPGLVRPEQEPTESKLEMGMCPSNSVHQTDSIKSLDMQLRAFVDPTSSGDTAALQSCPWKALFSKKRWKLFLCFLVFLTAFDEVQWVCKLVVRENPSADLACEPFPDYYTVPAMKFMIVRQSGILFILVLCAICAATRRFRGLQLAWVSVYVWGIGTFAMSANHRIPPSGWGQFGEPAPSSFEVWWYNLGLASCLVVGAVLAGGPNYLQRYHFSWFWLLYGASFLFQTAVGVAVSGHWFGWNLILSVISGVIGGVAVWRLRTGTRRARKLVSEDESRYDSEWQDIWQKQELEVLSLAKSAGTFAPGLIKQPACSLDSLFEDAALVDSSFQHAVSSWAARCDGIHHLAPRKGISRTLQKVRRAYGDEASKLVDVVRSAIVFQSVAALRACLELILKESDVRRLKNRFDPAYNAASSAGYRDLSLNIAWPLPGGREHVCEVQLHLAPIYALKTEGGHRRYIQFRNALGG